MHQLIDKKNRILIYLIFLVVLSTINNKSLEIYKKKPIKPIKINVSGLSSNNNLEIKEELNKLYFKNIFFIDKEDIVQIISKYNLVEKYSIKKVYPKQVNIEIEQTKILAEIKGKNKFLVGSNGKLISNEYTDQALPILFGKFNSKEFLKFKEIIKNSKFKFKDFKAIFFFPSNRWDIQTLDGFLIKLPEKNLDEALNIAYKVIESNHFKDIKVVDLRISNHIVTEE
jgi:cell division protein FtsQ